MASNKMKLYYFPGWRSFRNIWLIKGDDADADANYRKHVHPHGTIPALVVPGKVTLLESGNICAHIAEKYGKFIPEDRTEYNDMIMYVKVTLDGLLDFFYGKWFQNEEFSAGKEQKVRSKLAESLNYLSTRLQGRNYICGEQFTAADCVLGYALDGMARWKDGELLKDRLKLHEYLARLRARPAYQATHSMT